MVNEAGKELIVGLLVNVETDDVIRVGQVCLQLSAKISLSFHSSVNNRNKLGNKKGGTSFLTAVYTLKPDFGRTHEVTAQLLHKSAFF